MGCYGYCGLTHHGSEAAGKDEVLGLLSGPGAQDPVPLGGVAPRQQCLGQVKVIVHMHKYLGVQLSFRKSLQAVHYVQDFCLSWLAPLWLLANRGLGAGIPVLRMFYISVVRSLFDFARPVLTQFSAIQLRPLELAQN
ncbi:hypothetical protein E2C01_033501 [Portunus trituberculatus]|uniref:Uncharacterized protein n=1 Tax=Portunus trituberculatus TaxID=210409 RepID=A0A5B7F488_PORTR|nr:hypothetical protein [Portunus trituberculatus]